MRNQRKQNAAYYDRHRASELQRVRARQDQTRDWLRRLRDRPCADCGGSYGPHQMDFDHRDPNAKSFRLTSGAAMLASPDRLARELAKCDVVCANCHRLRTLQRRPTIARSSLSRDPVTARRREGWRQQLRILTELKQTPCADCHGTYPPCAMDFDHRDPDLKSYTVSRMIGRAGTARILAEVAKCDIVCANCHRERTLRRREAVTLERE